MESVFLQKYSIPVFIGDWSGEEQLNFHYALNHLFINGMMGPDFYQEIMMFVQTKSIQEIKMFSLWYFLSEIHNKNEWSQIEHYTFMKGFMLFDTDFVEIKKYLPFRTLVDVHEYASRVLPQFSMHTDLFCYENIVQNTDLSVIATFTGASESLYIPAVRSDIESTKLIKDYAESVCKHRSAIDFDLDLEPIPLGDMSMEQEVLDDSNLEFLFETLFD